MGRGVVGWLAAGLGFQRQSVLPAQSEAYAAAKQRFRKQGLQLKAYEPTETNVDACMRCRVNKKTKKRGCPHVAG